MIGFFLKHLLNMAAALLVVACQQPEEYKPNVLLPLAVGNRWEFVDSLVTDTGVAVQGRALPVQSFRTDSLGTWWSFMLAFEPFGGEWMQRNDTLFGFTTTRDGIVLALRYIPPKGEDTVYFPTPVDDDVPTMSSVVAIPGKYATAVGQFSNCALYRVRNVNSYSLVQTVLCPGIGPVAQDLYVGNTHRKLRLTSYTLVP
jgi:hypothetical protein